MTTASTSPLTSLDTNPYRTWTPWKVMLEAKRRGIYDHAMLFSNQRRTNPLKLTELLHEDDADHLAAQGRYEGMDEVQLRHQLEMVGINHHNHQHFLSREEIIKHLQALDKAAITGQVPKDHSANRSSSSMSSSSSLTPSPPPQSRKRHRSVDSGYISQESSYCDIDYGPEPPKKMIYVMKDGVKMRF